MEITVDTIKALRVARQSIVNRNEPLRDIPKGGQTASRRGEPRKQVVKDPERIYWVNAMIGRTLTNSQHLLALLLANPGQQIMEGPEAVRRVEVMPHQGDPKSKDPLTPLGAELRQQIVKVLLKNLRDLECAGRHGAP